jgi:hypothetical protein
MRGARNFCVRVNRSIDIVASNALYTVVLRG